MENMHSDTERHQSGGDVINKEKKFGVPHFQTSSFTLAILFFFFFLLKKNIFSSFFFLLISLHVLLQGFLFFKVVKHFIDFSDLIAWAIIICFYLLVCLSFSVYWILYFSADVSFFLTFSLSSRHTFTFPPFFCSFICTPPNLPPSSHLYATLFRHQIYSPSVIIVFVSPFLIHLSSSSCIHL